MESLHRRAELLAAGFTSDEVQRERTAGRLVTVARGTYVTPDDERLAQAEGQHLLRVLAVAPRLAPGSVISHVSAAVLHGLPVWGMSLRRVHSTRDGTTGGRVRARSHRHVAPLRPDEIVVVDGVCVTSVARTLADLGRTEPLEPVVATADAALRTEQVDPGLLDAGLLRAARWPGAPAARRALGFADGRSGSVGESRSRVALHRAGLPVPVLQWNVVSAGRVIAETDFGWPELRTVGEFDGKVKYGRLLRAGQSAGDAVYAEKLREDDIRAEDLGVVRWTWGDLDQFRDVAVRLERNFERARTPAAPTERVRGRAWGA